MNEGYYDSRSPNLLQAVAFPQYLLAAKNSQTRTNIFFVVSIMIWDHMLTKTKYQITYQLLDTPTSLKLGCAADELTDSLHFVGRQDQSFENGWSFNLKFNRNSLKLIFSEYLRRPSKP